MSSFLKSRRQKKKTDISHQPEIKTRLYLGLQEIHMEGSTCFAFNVNIVSFTWK